MVKWYGTTTDIDDTKAAENVLRYTEAQRAAIIAHAPIGMYLIDSEMRLREINERARPFFAGIEQPIGVPIANMMRLMWPEEAAEEFTSRFRRTLQTGESYLAPTFGGTLRGGEVKYFDWEVHRVTLPDGQHGLVCYFIDVSAYIFAQKRLHEREHELCKLSEGLENRVQQRTVELEEKTARLRSLANELTSAEHRERKRLAALLHDDLQQLLVAARMQMGLINSHVTDENGRQGVRQATRWIGEAVEAARDLTRQLRPPTLYEGGLVAALHGLATEMRDRHALEILIEAKELSRPLNDDTKALVFECIRELLFNVAKYADVEHAVVKVGEEGEHLRVVILDEGCGFDVGALGDRHQGDGFGIFSIRERMAALGGDLKIESFPKQGTRIELLVPAAEEDLRDTTNQPEAFRSSPLKQMHSAISADSRTRVLVVDDHAMVREGIANLIAADERLQVVGEAADGIEAIQAVGKTSPDVVLMDLNMPGLNGIEATREIRSAWPNVLFIGLSVQNDAATAKSMIDAGAAAFLSKAGDTEKMIIKILDLVRAQSGTETVDCLA